MNSAYLSPRILSVAFAAAFPIWAHGADCADRFTSTQFDYLGRSADSSKSYWLTLSNRADSFRVSAPGVASIDTWQSTGPSTHITESDVVKNDVNGIHKLDRMKPGGSFDCFLQSHGQTRPHGDHLLNQSVRLQFVLKCRTARSQIAQNYQTARSSYAQNYQIGQ